MPEIATPNPFNSDTIRELVVRQVVRDDIDKKPKPKIISLNKARYIAITYSGYIDNKRRTRGTYTEYTPVVEDSSPRLAKAKLSDLPNRITLNLEARRDIQGTLLSREFIPQFSCTINYGNQHVELTRFYDKERKEYFDRTHIQELTSGTTGYESTLLHYSGKLAEALLIN